MTDRATRSGSGTVILMGLMFIVTAAWWAYHAGEKIEFVNDCVRNTSIGSVECEIRYYEFRALRNIGDPK